jgi:hypothetical protein
MNEQELEQYWNNKHPKTPIIYGGRQIPNFAGKIPIDVRKMFWTNDYVLIDLIKKENLYVPKNDDFALVCQQYIVKNCKYEYDQDSWGYNEFWQFPNETLYLKRGDCEDGSLLMASLLCSNGVPWWRVRVNAGLVQDNNGQQEGHCYVTYCRETDNNWIILDWCYKQDSDVPVKDKILAKNNLNYQEIWFSFTSLFSWSYKQYDVFENINEEPKTLFNDV